MNFGSQHDKIENKNTSQFGNTRQQAKISSYTIQSSKENTAYSEYSEWLDRLVITPIVPEWLLDCTGV